MPSLINLTHVNIWTTVTTPGSSNDMWLHSEGAQPPNPLSPSPKERAERARFPVPGVDHEKLLAAPDFMLADERSIVTRDLVAGATRDQKYYFLTKYVTNGHKGSRYLQIAPQNVTTHREFLPKYSLIVMLLACIHPAFSRNNSVCDSYAPIHSLRPSKNRDAYRLYFLQGDESGTCLCVNDTGKLYVEDCSSVLSEGRGECVFYVKPPESDLTMNVIYSYQYPRNMKQCRDREDKRHRGCSKRWYVQIKGGQVKTRRAKPSRPLDHTVTFRKQPQAGKDGVDQKKFGNSLPTTTAPLIRHVPKGSAFFDLNKRRRSRKKKKSSSRGFNLLSGLHTGLRHRKNRARKKGGGYFLIGHDN
ncbi:hypothetical protein CAPTEDRAFT_222641 [Capitella teleta]|uniref:Uncharacterized protein n=1 Tax=Capitella teleta TaxID=283909 RepID=R7UDB6_CAPTE|nr:hypothetical protein CAPTEDRAFT_222641 [Capitella teleta]|eukprot:ELU03949.1 hypothetical protein CAPTEDRAFT_222641 [Capitella teleta]